MSVETLHDFPLSAEGDAGRRFATLGLFNYHDAARHVWKLPYGRNSDRSEWWLVLEEQRGTCSTKHALLAELAREHDQPVSLVLGIYEMSEANTPGVGAVLEKHGLRCLPEAHCCLVYDGAHVDLTRDGQETRPVEGFVSEEEIAPCQIGDYKVNAHRDFVRRWAARRGLDFARVWRAREECIAVLAD